MILYILFYNKNLKCIIQNLNELALKGSEGKDK